MVAVAPAVRTTMQDRKERGAFFTPYELSSFIANWAITSVHQKVLEPSCGEGDLLLAAVDRLEALGATKQQVSANLTGYEIHADSVAETRRRLAARDLSCTIRRGDFLSRASKKSFDAVIGNPPYVRYQSISAQQRKTISAIANKSNVSICALASTWMPFVIQSALHLKKGGRLGFVLPAELLTVNYAAPLRQFLLASFTSVRLVTFDERVFPGVQEEVVLLLAEGWHEGSSKSIAWQPCASVADLASGHLVEYEPQHQTARWSALFAEEGAVESLKELADRGSFVSLEAWGAVSLGIVTGRNGYFALSQAALERWGLTQDDVVTVSPPGSKHLRRLEYGQADHERLCAGGKGVHLFYPQEPLSKAARRYIEYGESLGVHEAYKCRVRSPWWRVPLGKRPDAFVTYMNAYGPSICLNTAGAFTLNSCHGLLFSEGIDLDLRELFPLACLNSATMLGAEIKGRAYGGGILKLEPREAAALPVPSPALVRACASELRALKPYVSELLRSRDFDGALSLVDAVLVPKLGVEEGRYLQFRSSATLMRTRRKTRSKRAQGAS